MEMNEHVYKMFCLDLDSFSVRTFSYWIERKTIKSPFDFLIFRGKYRFDFCSELCNNFHLHEMIFYFILF